MFMIRNLLKRSVSLPLFRQMHFVQYEYMGFKRVGVLSNVSVASGPVTSQSPGPIIDLNQTDPHIPNDLRTILEGGAEMQSRVESAVSSSHRRMVSGSEVRLLAPIHPAKIILIGLNYRGHCLEQKVELPKLPIISSRFGDTVVGPDADVIHSKETKELDWEVELAIVIGKIAKNVKVESAMDHVFGYTIANDLSARDLQLSGNAHQWTLGKNLDTSCPLGPWIVTTDSIGDPHNLGIRCRVNGVTKQDANTNELVFNTQNLLAYITRFTTLKPGDVIITGTPAGVGFARKPPEFLKPGDVVECEIDGIGCLKNKIIGE